MDTSKEADTLIEAAKQMDDLDARQQAETHELTEAEVEEIHSKGSPHQHLDPTPHENYGHTMLGQVVGVAKEKRDALRAKVGEQLRAAMPKRVIPRYLRRAVWSKDPVKIYKAIHRAKAEGWTNEEMVRQVRLISEENAINKEYEVQESNQNL